MRLIDADTLKEYFEKCLKTESGKDGTKERYAYMSWLRGVQAIDNAPTVQTANARKRTQTHGKWIKKETYNEDLDKCVPWIECSECGYAPYYTGIDEQNYCSDCGAKMQGEE